MSYAQLYYTSCEHGISGGAGYQFNAATPGVGSHILDHVERFTVYDPPASGVVADHPVNLCYTPDIAGVGVVARVVSTGDDPSGRPGNYFVHALVGEVQDDPLPVELWQAPFWFARPTTHPQLPALPVPLPAGPLDRTRIAAWLRGQSTELFARIITAVDRAIDDGPPVALIADSATVAHWIAAVSQALAPQRARAMSFATYASVAGAPPVHVTGLLPAEAGNLGAGFVCFELSLENALEARVGDSPRDPRAQAHPLAVRLAETGVVFTATVWQEAVELGQGREHSLEEWHPLVLATAALRLGERLAANELGRVCQWLPGGAHRLAREEVTELVGLILDALEPNLSDSVLAELHEAAQNCGAGAAAERIEETLVLRALDSLAQGGAPPRGVPIRGESVRRAAVDRITALLVAAAEGTPHTWVPVVTAMLDWASASGLELPTEELRRLGRDVLAPVVMAEADSPPDVAAQLLGEHLDVCRGVADALAGQHRAALLVLLRGPLGTLLSGHGRDRGAVADVPAALAEHPRLCELHRIATTPQETEPRRLLFDVIRLRRELRQSGLAAASTPNDLDLDLLRDVWGHRGDPEAVVLSIRDLRSGVQVAPGVDEWVSAAVVRPPEQDQAAAWRELVTELDSHWLGGRLSAAAGTTVRQWRHYRELRASTPEETCARLAEIEALLGGAEDGTASPALGTVVRHDLSRLMLRVGRTRSLASLLRDCHDELFDSFCVALAERLNEQGARPELAARGYLAAGAAVLAVECPQRAHRLHTEVLPRALETWDRRELTEIRTHIPPAHHIEFDDWSRQLRAPGRSSRLLQRLVGGWASRP